MDSCGAILGTGREGDVIKVEDNLDFFRRLAKGLSEHFGKGCEIAVHDLTNGYEHTIVAIENGNITGRNIGDGASELVLEAIKSGGDIPDHYSYQTRSKDGRIMKSTSVFIKDEQSGKVNGLFCINFDITDLLGAKLLLDSMTGTEDTQENTDVIPTNVNDLLDQLIDESCKHIGKPVALMTKEDKIRAIKYLDMKGAFLIKKSGDRVSKYYDISKFTLYNYLDAYSKETDI